MNGRCATCRHWGFPGYLDDFAITEERAYHRVPAAAKTCRLFSDGERDDRLLLAKPGDPYVGADVWTLPAFGCVQHESA